MKIGILALQGGYAAHASALKELGHCPLEIRIPNQLKNIDGFVFPGGESSTQLKLIHRFKLESALQKFIQSGKPVLATCAGLILCAKKVSNPSQKSFGWLDIAIERNAWGSQLDSFEALSDQNHLPLCFIRAPRITQVGPKVEVLATYKSETILVKQANVVGATFHPELTSDRSIHQSVFG